MRIWLALLAAPRLALTDQSVAYATAGWACAHQHAAVVHGVHLLFLAAIVSGTVMAWRYWRATPAMPEPAASRHFLAGIAAGSGALSALVILAMWIPNWLLSPALDRGARRPGRIA